ncbi:hypothetical protein [Microbacterium kunmingense]|uniref:hypothetical protein n=1 Tax=Microbacterium kunmingense TaxID=2915939 RepID=UPI002005D308|nr:hypothetical protein [Microbacterium kunmingense]
MTQPFPEQQTGRDQSAKQPVRVLSDRGGLVQDAGFFSNGTAGPASSADHTVRQGLPDSVREHRTTVDIPAPLQLRPETGAAEKAVAEERGDLVIPDVLHTIPERPAPPRPKAPARDEQFEPELRPISQRPIVERRHDHQNLPHIRSRSTSTTGKHHRVVKNRNRLL